MIKENEQNKYDVDSVEMHTLHDEMQKHVEQDNNEGIEQNMNLNENIDNNSNKTDDELDEEQNASDEKSDYDSVQERIAWRLMHPDADSDYSELDEGSVESKFELWYKNRTKHKHEFYSE